MVDSTSNTNHWPSIRVIHLVGGAIAISSNDSTVVIEPKTIHGLIAQFDTRQYGAVYSDLEDLGLSIAGVDFYSNASTARGESPPDWRVYNRTESGAWPSENATQKWSGIAHSAFDQKLGYEWDLASRISHQIEVCSWRVRQLSRAYNHQLKAKSAKNQITLGFRFDDGYTWNIYLAVQSYLIDACILRDYLSEFLADCIFTNRYKVEKFNISTASALIKKVLGEIPATDPLSIEFNKITGDSGWLKALGEYRDLVVHSSPLAHAKNRLFATIGAVQIDSEGAIPIIQAPLPKEPGKISASRASRKHFSDFESQLSAYAESVKEGHPTVDALSYIVETHGELAKLALRVAYQSPVAYQQIVVSQKDIIGPIKITPYE